MVLLSNKRGFIEKEKNSGSQMPNANQTKMRLPSAKEEKKPEKKRKEKGRVSERGGHKRLGLVTQRKRSEKGSVCGERKTKKAGN